MYPVGHMAEGYLVAWLVAKGRNQRLSLWLALTMGLLPDFDLLFGGIGLVHETYTHSLVTLVPLAVMLVALRRGSLPYVGALITHDVGDLLIGSFPLFYPLSRVDVGLFLRMSSVADAAMEVASLAAMLWVMWRWGDLLRIMSRSRENLLMVVPLVSMVGLMWFRQNGTTVNVVQGASSLIGFGFSRQSLAVISLCHIVIGLIMAASVFLALIAYRTRIMPKTIVHL